MQKNLTPRFYFLLVTDICLLLARCREKPETKPKINWWDPSAVRQEGLLIMWKKCSMDETVPIKLESSTCVKEIITTFFCSVHSCFCCDRCPYCNDSSETWIETPFVPNTTGFLSCFFGPTMPCFFQTVLSPFYSSEDLTCRASTFQRLPLEEGTAGFG